jgi:hypothetical protein
MAQSLHLRTMSARRSISLSLALLLITAHRLPAPIQELPENPTPAPIERKSKRTLNAKESMSDKAPAKKAASMTDQEVRVILSENTRMSLMHLRTYVETGEKIPFAPKSDVKPDEILGRLRQVLSNRFRSVSILNDSSGSQSRSGLVMVFDLQAHVGMTSGEKNTVSIVGTFKDGSGKPIQTITAAGSTTVHYPAWRTHFPEEFSAALSEFSQKLGNYRQ